VSEPNPKICEYFLVAADVGDHVEKQGVVAQGVIMLSYDNGNLIHTKP